MKRSPTPDTTGAAQRSRANTEGAYKASPPPRSGLTLAEEPAQEPIVPTESEKKRKDEEAKEKEKGKEKEEEVKEDENGATAAEDMHSAHGEDEESGEDDEDKEMLPARSDPWCKLVQGLQAEVSSHCKRLCDLERAVHGLCWAVLPPFSGEADSPQLNQLLQELQDELEQWPEAISHARRQGRTLVVGCRTQEWKREVRNYLTATLEGTNYLVVQHSTETDRQWRGAAKMAFYCLQEAMTRKEKGKEKGKEKEKEKGKGRGGKAEGKGPSLRTVWPQPGRTSWEIWGENEGSQGCSVLLATGHQASLGLYRVLFKRQAQLSGGFKLHGPAARQVWEGDPERGRRLPVRTVTSVKEALEEVVPEKEKKGEGRGGGGPEKGKGRGGKSRGGPARDRERRHEKDAPSRRGGNGPSVSAGGSKTRKNKNCSLPTVATVTTRGPRWTLQPQPKTHEE